MVKDTLHLLQEHVEDSESSYHCCKHILLFVCFFFLLVKLDHIDVNNQTSILVHCGIQLLL
jgi:hypothetical protein